MHIEKQQLIDDFKKIGITKGDHVAVALSFKSMGHIKGGPEGFLDALLKVIGPEGTLMVNAFTNYFPLSKIDCDYVFDFASTKPLTGLVPTRFLKLKGMVRSKHPIVSVAAVGKYAKYLTDDHNENSSHYLPYEKLAKLGGKHLFIGIDDRLVAVRHQSQIQAGLWIVPQYWGVKYVNSKGQQKLFITRLLPCATAMPKLVPILEKNSIIKRGKIGNADAIISSANRLNDAMVKMLQKNPALTLCDNVLCLCCRELEERLNLYKKIQNPRLFQRSFFVRKIVSLRNKLVLKKYSYVAYCKDSQQNPLQPFGKIEFVLTRILAKTQKHLMP